LFILTAIVAVGCLIGPPIVREAAIAWERRNFRFDNQDQVAATAILVFVFWMVAHRHYHQAPPAE
jgi:hypothetical protein